MLSVITFVSLSILIVSILISSQYASASQDQPITKANAQKCKGCQSSAGPQTPQSKNYESTGTNFGENSFGGPPQLNRDTPDDTLNKIATQMGNPNGGNIVIPSWVEKSVKYYSEGSISYNDIIKELHYLIQKGIIKV